MRLSLSIGLIALALCLESSPAHAQYQPPSEQLLMQAVGSYGLPYVPEELDAGWSGELAGPEYAAPLSGLYFNMRKTSIYSGSNEIQKNIISQMILGL